MLEYSVVLQVTRTRGQTEVTETYHEDERVPSNYQRRPYVKYFMQLVRRAYNSTPRTLYMAFMFTAPTK